MIARRQNPVVAHQICCATTENCRRTGLPLRRDNGGNG